QAEDGIRDKLVTGVQTCALPICSALAPRASGAEPKRLSPIPRAPKIIRGTPQPPARDTEEHFLADFDAGIVWRDRQGNQGTWFRSAPARRSRFDTLEWLRRFGSGPQRKVPRCILR